MSTFRRGILKAVILTLGLLVGVFAALFASNGRASAAALEIPPPPVATATTTAQSATQSSSTTSGSAISVATTVTTAPVTISITIKALGTKTTSIIAKADTPPATTTTPSDHTASTPAATSGTSTAKDGATTPPTATGTPTPRDGSAQSSTTKPGGTSAGTTQGGATDAGKPGTSGSGDTTSTGAQSGATGSAGTPTDPAKGGATDGAGAPGVCAVVTSTHDAPPASADHASEPTTTGPRVMAKAPCKPADGTPSTGTTGDTASQTGSSTGTTTSGATSDQPTVATAPAEGTTALSHQVTLLPVVPATPVQPQQPRPAINPIIWHSGSHTTLVASHAPAATHHDGGAGTATPALSTTTPAQPVPALPTDHPSENALGGYSVGASSSSGSGGSVDSGPSGAVILPTIELPATTWRALYIQSFLMPSGVTTSIQLPPW